MDDLRYRSTAIDLNSHNSSGLDDSYAKFSWLNRLKNNLGMLGRDWKGKKIIFLSLINFMSLLMMFLLSKSSNSMGLVTYSYLLAFDALCLVASVMSSWIEKQSTTSSFTYGYERFEVLTLFSATVLLQLGSLFIVKECFERLFLVSQDVDMSNVLPGLIIGLGCHLLVVYGIHSRALNYIVASSSSNWLQEHVAEISQSVCHMIPGLSRILLPRLNPLVLLGWGASFLLFVSYLLVVIYKYMMVDSLAALGLALVTIITLYPMCVNSGRILLQTVPGHIVGQLDKCLREASTLDGVLEFRFEHFWTLAYDDMVGTLHVRVRRDANDQLVLAHLVDRLSNIIKHLTIQVFKEDWSRPSFQLLNDSRLHFSDPASFQPNGAAQHFPSAPIKTF